MIPNYTRFHHVDEYVHLAEVGNFRWIDAFFADRSLGCESTTSAVVWVCLRSTPRGRQSDYACAKSIIVIRLAADARTVAIRRALEVAQILCLPVRLMA